MKNYDLKKNQLRQQIIDDINKMKYKSLSWLDIANYQRKIYPLAKKYGLLKELKENGIL